MDPRRRMSRYASINEIVERERLVERIRLRDESAFDRLFHLVYSPLVDFARRYMTSPQDAEELVTDLLVRLWEMESRWVVRGAVMTYLFGAVRNRAFDYRESLVTLLRRSEEIEAHFSNEVPSRTDDPLLSMDLEALSIRARAVLDALSPRAREVFLLIRRDGLSIREAAAVLGVTPSTVQTQLGRAVLAFQRALGEG